MRNIFRSSLYQKVNRLSNISIEQLVQSGIRGIILDLDNTIVSEDDLCMSPYAEQWIVKAKSSGIRFFLLSNGKRKFRVEQWSRRLKIQSLSPARKPFPFAFRHALKQLGLNKAEVIVIGDGLHTDIFGAWLYRLKSIQVASLPHAPRWWERLAGRWLQITYPYDQEVWKLDELDNLVE